MEHIRQIYMRIYIIKLHERAIDGENRAQPIRTGRQNPKKTQLQEPHKRD